MSGIIKPSILAGFMELLPEDQIIFNDMMDTIRKTYESFGFLPIDTPVMEKQEILLAKGGGETAQQMYKIDKGDTDIGLRFDLTVPLARYVSMRFPDLNFPFRRYHIGKVYRGERNQRGRYREFYQCDIDIIGNGSLDILNDAEILSVIYTTFKNIGLKDVTIKINNRRLLTGFFKSVGVEDGEGTLRIIDKIEKIGEEKVREELSLQGISNDSIDSIMNFIKIDGTNDEIIEALKNLNIEEETFVTGFEEMKSVNKYVKLFGVPEDVYQIDLTIARGLDYYTGTVYETFLNEHKNVGSICSGGRYDNLAGNYTKQHLPGVGISIGLTRLFFVLNDLGLVNKEKNYLTKLMILPMGETMEESVKISSKLREEGIKNQIYYEKAKTPKKFGYADKGNIPFVLIIGSEEIELGKYTLRDMKTGEQEMLSIDELIEKLK